VRDSGLPWTTLRATQFRDAFLIMGRQMAKMPFVPVFAGPLPADRRRRGCGPVVELALGLAAGPVPEMAGPRVYAMAELLRGSLKARGKNRLIMPMRLPGRLYLM
jgi:uncharacterized protein YbjT (DUF2867 family)